LIIKIQEHFQFCPDWYRRSPSIRELVGQYYVVLRSLLRQKLQLRPYVRRCRRCRIFFLTHPRNAGRRDLACPFGCRQADRRQNSTRRSVEYYRSREGKAKKRLHNQRRRRRRAPTPAGTRQRNRGRGPRTTVEEMMFDCGIVRYVQMVVGLIEGRRVGEAEILRMLARAVRQHSMARRRRREYVLSCWRGTLESP
jgi:hypothetical protein